MPRFTSVFQQPARSDRRRYPHHHAGARACLVGAAGKRIQPRTDADTTHGAGRL